MESGKLEERIFEAIFGNGKDGLLTRVSRLDDSVGGIKQAIEETNSLLRTSVIPQLQEAKRYEEQLPVKDREDILVRVRAHLEQADEQKLFFGKVSKGTLRMAFYIAQAAVLSMILAKLGLG